MTRGVVGISVVGDSDVDGFTSVVTVVGSFVVPAAVEKGENHGSAVNC